MSKIIERMKQLAEEANKKMEELKQVIKEEK